MLKDHTSVLVVTINVYLYITASLFPRHAIPFGFLNVLNQSCLATFTNPSQWTSCLLWLMSVMCIIHNTIMYNNVDVSVDSFEKSALYCHLTITWLRNEKWIQTCWYDQSSFKFLQVGFCTVTVLKWMSAWELWWDVLLWYEHYAMDG